MIHSHLLSRIQNISSGLCVKESELNKNEIEQFITLTQIHSNKIIAVPNEYNETIQADGMYSDKNVSLAIKTADCLPILMCEPKSGFIAAIHAGWKGLYLGIIENTVHTLSILGISISNINIVIGPHIGICCYNVSPERIGYFSDLHVPKNSFRRNKNTYYLDIGRIALYKLMQSKVKEKNIELIKTCTCCNSDFESYRRDGENSKRMYSYIKKIS
jgi:polyphenol oxidase